MISHSSRRQPLLPSSASRERPHRRRNTGNSVRVNISRDAVRAPSA